MFSKTEPSTIPESTEVSLSQRMRNAYTDRGSHHRPKNVNGNACPALHQAIDSKRFEKAIIEAKKKNQKHLEAIMAVSRNSDWDRNTRDLFRYNPVALGQILAEEPEYAEIACRELDAVKSRDDRNEDLIKKAMWGGMIVGGALLVPLGVGLAAGSTVLLAGVGSAGIALGGATVTWAVSVSSITIDSKTWNHKYYRAGKRAFCVRSPANQ